MKIYKHEPQHIVRLQILKTGEKGEFLNLIETNVEEVKAMVVALITAQQVSPFAKGFRTSVNIRDAIGGKNGKSESISFRGLSPKQTHDLIVNHVSKEQ